MKRLPILETVLDRTQILARKDKCFNVVLISAVL